MHTPVKLMTMMMVDRLPTMLSVPQAGKSRNTSDYQYQTKEPTGEFIGMAQETF